MRASTMKRQARWQLMCSLGLVVEGAVACSGDDLGQLEADATASSRYKGTWRNATAAADGFSLLVFKADGQAYFERGGNGRSARYDMSYETVRLEAEGEPVEL